MDTVELPLVHVLRETEKTGIKLDTKQLRRSRPAIRADVVSSSARSGARGRVRASARRSSSPSILFEKLS
jgi:DNA polymerase I-like protein with 3'-5' exonuclease and polymerase domains